MLKALSLFGIVIFLLGITLGSLYADYAQSRQPIQTTVNPGKVFPLTNALPIERASPADWIPENKIEVYPDKVLINIPHVQWSRFANTNSMDPILDETSNALQIIPTSQEQIHEGDIVSYETTEGTIIHRVITTSNDSKGWYAIMKGDNSLYPDPEKVRWNQIKKIVIGILY